MPHAEITASKHYYIVCLKEKENICINCLINALHRRAYWLVHGFLFHDVCFRIIYINFLHISTMFFSILFTVLLHCSI